MGAAHHRDLVHLLRLVHFSGTQHGHGKPNGSCVALLFLMSLAWPDLLGQHVYSLHGIQVFVGRVGAARRASTNYSTRVSGPFLFTLVRDMNLTNYLTNDPTNEVIEDSLDTRTIMDMVDDDRKIDEMSVTTPSG